MNVYLGNTVAMTTPHAPTLSEVILVNVKLNIVEMDFSVKVGGSI